MLPTNLNDIEDKAHKKLMLVLNENPLFAGFTIEPFTIICRANGPNLADFLYSFPNAKPDHKGNLPVMPAEQSSWVFIDHADLEVGKVYTFVAITKKGRGLKICQPFLCLQEGKVTNGKGQSIKWNDIYKEQGEQGLLNREHYGS